MLVTGWRQMVAGLTVPGHLTILDPRAAKAAAGRGGCGHFSFLRWRRQWIMADEAGCVTGRFRGTYDIGWNDA